MPPVKTTTAPKNGTKNGTPTSAPPAKVERKVEYPEFKAKVCVGESAIKVQQMKKLLGWESEAEYKVRLCKDDKSLKGEEITYGDDYVLKDEYGQKIRLWHVTINRPFTEVRARKYAQTILNRHWAGPMNFPGETITSDAIGIGRCGEAAQGVHRGVGLILAGQRWEREDGWKEKWPTEPVLESLVVFGMSEDPRILACLDNVDPRSESDVLYTSNIFGDLEVSIGGKSVRPANSKEKQDCCRMLARAIDVLWIRLDAPGLDKTNKYKTHTLAMDFQRRHGTRLKECTIHIFQENMHRGLSSLKLSQGECVAMMYLMGCSGSSGEQVAAYRLNDPLPSEDKLDWSRMDKAKKFWVEMAKPMKVGKSKLVVVQRALDALLSADGGGRAMEKRAIICKAWDLFVAGDDIEEADLDLSEHWQEKDEEMKFVNAPDFGGPDIGEKKTKDEEENLTEAQVEENKKKEQERFRLEMEQKLEAAKKKAAGPSATVAEPGAPDGKPPAPKVLATPANKRPNAATSGKASQGAAKSPPAPKGPAPKAKPEGAGLAGAIGKVGPALGTPAKKGVKK